MSRSRRNTTKVGPDCLRTIPELTTRTNLVNAMNNHPGLRRAILSTIDHLWQISYIPDPPVAVEILDMYYAHVKHRFGTIWRPKLLDCTPTIHEGHVLWAECHGLLRNIYYNVGALLGRKKRHKWGPHDVVRKPRRLEDAA